MPVNIDLPQLSADFESGNVTAWHKREGDRVEIGDVLLDVETDKATIEVPAAAAGVLGKIIVPAGSDDVPVHTLLGLLLEEGESDADLADVSNTESAPVEAESSPDDRSGSAAAEDPVRNIPASRGDGRVFASPLARRIAVQNDIDITTLSGRGPGGRILRRDVEAVTARVEAASAAQPGPAGNAYIAIPNSNVRKVIARRLGESKREVPHFYLTVDCRIDKLLDARKEVNGQAPEGTDSYKLSVNDFVIKACALALCEVPEANASWTEEAIHRYSDVDISVAVATEKGLITPVVCNADQKGLVCISREVKALSEKARAGKLTPAEYRGGGFSLSNLGMYGIKEFSAIINPPQSCILAVGAAEQRPVVQDGKVVPATVMTCTLSVDHRSVDGAVGATFMSAFKTCIENPLGMLWRDGR